MELTDNEIQLLAQLSRDRRLYAECKGADLDALQKLGLLQWFDARSSTTPFKEDPRPLFRLLLFSGRIDYFWVEPVEHWRELVGPEVSAKVDAIDEIEWAVTSGALTGAGLVEHTRSGPLSLNASAANGRTGGRTLKPDRHCRWPGMSDCPGAGTAATATEQAEVVLGMPAATVV